ncbi:MAG: MarR family winged helix-turn-helix transcriptional regulator [Actinomycetota bacterium]
MLTTVGLLVEAHAGLSVAVEHRLHEGGHVAGQPFEILLRLLRSPGHRLRMSDLAAQTTLTASGLTRAVDRLEGSGLVARTACATDRRVSYAELTEAGEAEIRAALPVHVAHLQEIFAGFDPVALGDLECLLRRLRDVLNPAAASASDPEPEPA